MLYAALKACEKEEMEKKDKESSRSKRGLFAVKRLETARKWMLEFLKAAMVRPMRKISVGPGKAMEVKICCDASPEGLGAVLIINQAPIAALASHVEEIDGKLLNFEMGSPSSQGILEALCLLVALRHWHHRLQGHKLQVQVQSDSMVALALSQRLAASTPSLNWIGAETALALEELGVEELQSLHIPGKANLEADHLSRPSLWKTEEVPEGLKVLVAHIETPAVRDEGFYRLPGPTVEPALWGSGGGETSGIAAWDSAI